MIVPKNLQNHPSSWLHSGISILHENSKNINDFCIVYINLKENK